MNGSGTINRKNRGEMSKASGTKSAKKTTTDRDAKIKKSLRLGNSSETVFLKSKIMPDEKNKIARIPSGILPWHSASQVNRPTTGLFLASIFGSSIFSRQLIIKQ